jgi:uncharacterized membrane protein
MNYLKYTQYFYLIFAGFFAYDAFTKFSNNEPFYLQLLFVALAVFMFFFRRKFAKKFEDRENNKK